MLRWFFSRREPPAEQTVMLLRQFQVVAESGARLEEALPVLAESVEDRRLRNRIEVYRTDHAEGDGDPAALLKSLLPARLTPLIGVGLRHGKLPDVLRSLAKQESRGDALRRRLHGVLAYPLMIGLLLFAKLYFFSVFLVPQFRELFTEFELDLPVATEVTLAAYQVVPWAGVAIVDAALAIGLMLLWKPTCRLVHWLRTAVPVLGRVWVWASHEQFCDQMATLGGMGVPTADALRCSAAGQRDLHLATATARLAERCASGATLADAMARSRHFERPLTALVNAGEQYGALPEAFADAAADYRRQLEHYAAFLGRIMLPLVTVAVVVVLMGVTFTLYLPLVSLIENLS